MSEIEYLVEPDGVNWKVSLQSEDSSPYDTLEEAIETAIEAARGARKFGFSAGVFVRLSWSLADDRLRPTDTVVLSVNQLPSIESAMSISFTLDTNCIIDLDQGQSSATDVLRLVKAHSPGEADVALVAVSASERQLGGVYLRNYSDFEKQVQTLGLSHLTVLLPILYWDIEFWDVGLEADAAMEKRERQIHAILFPNIEFDWLAYAGVTGATAITDNIAKKWRNAFCDRQMYWAHDHNNRDVFVTAM